MQENKLTISTTLIIISLLATLAVTYIPNLYQFGMNSYFLHQGIYHVWIIQFFTSQFLHGNFLHLLSNTLFVYYFGNILEQYIGSKKMLYFFIGNTVFIGLGLTLLTSANTVGISGFSLAILTYYTLLLRKKKNPEFTGGITAIVINILIGFVPGVSFWGHFMGMLFGGLYFFVTENVKKQ